MLGARRRCALRGYQSASVLRVQLGSLALARMKRGCL